MKTLISYDKNLNSKPRLVSYWVELHRNYINTIIKSQALFYISKITLLPL